LPAMDDDDFRRGRPSCHKQFNEAIAILAGDGLLTLAFETLGQTNSFSADSILQVVRTLGLAAGSTRGMIAGQVLDLEAEGMSVTASHLEAIHRSKTGALLTASVWIGAYLGGASTGDLEKITRYCERIGLAFQIVDDILDEKQSRDRDRGKATYPAIYGIDKSREIARNLLNEARATADTFGGRGLMLRQFCDYLEHRQL